MSSSAQIKPTVIGLYGIFGSGKSYLLNQLKKDTTLQDQRFAFYDGFELINQVTPDGLDVFKKLKRCQQGVWLEAALRLPKPSGDGRHHRPLHILDYLKDLMSQVDSILRWSDRHIPTSYI